MIETGPLTLRPPEAVDTAWIFHAAQDPELARWSSLPHPYRPSDAVAFVENRMGEHLPLVITRTETGELLGVISVKSFDPGTRRAEIGYWVAAEARGQGVASQALAGLTAHAWSSLGALVVEVRIADGNAASLAAAERAGFALTGRIPAGCHDGECTVDALVLTKAASR